MNDPYGHLAYLRAQELQRAAEDYRLGMLAERRTCPPLVMRLYARAWWASRPRAHRWAPMLLESSLR